MKKWQKVVLWILGPITGVVIIGFLGIFVFWHVIFYSNSCKRFNIDNIETRIRVDIPSIYGDQMECFLDKAAKTKTNYFRIRTDEVDMDRYVERNAFISAYGVNLDLSVFQILAKTPKITPDNIQDFYYNSGTGIRTSEWLAIVNKNSGDLWVYMNFKRNKN